MSRLFPDRLTVALAPAGVSLLRESGFPRRKTVERRTFPCDPAFGAEPWQGAVALLKTLTIDFPCRVTVALSSHFVRYSIVPWSNALSGATEEEAYVRHHFARIHGERAKAWVLRASEAAAGAPRLASAIDGALLEEIRKCFAQGGKARLASVQPQLMSRFNENRPAVPASGAWLVIVEPDRACVALHGGGGWRSVHSGKDEWLTLLERERHRVAGEIPNLVLIAGAPAPAPQGAWQFRALGA